MIALTTFILINDKLAAVLNLLSNKIQFKISFLSSILSVGTLTWNNICLSSRNVS